MHYSAAMTGLDIIHQSCVLQHLRAAARRVTALYEARLAPVNLTASQFSALVALGLAEGEPLSDLAARLAMDRTTLTRVLAPLVRRGLVATGPVEGDARLRAPRLTGPGRALLAEAVRLWQGAQEAALSRIGAEAWPDLRQRLDTLAG
ncbi:MAG: MarR family winged helix-turn-helix transcriptional regulator [Rhodobacteraceae bacterium]|nr:MarR family winged helix-turn-helix transcriptional regulator [Paracoccaceae bacterium]